jgi:2-polyprenyl-3-methyl-5-hydroxy-6-metoxy-1,4-benzoquinol methylase
MLSVRQRAPHSRRWGRLQQPVKEHTRGIGGASVSHSPYQLKDDPYSSHSVILSLLGEGRGRRLLDTGAADGFLAEVLTARGWIVTAVERDPVQAERARGKCHEVVAADLIEAAPKLRGPFDAIVYGDVLEHLADPIAALRSVNPSLAPGGLVVISIPNVAHLWVRLSLLLGRFEYAERGILDRTHLRFFTRRTLLELLAQAELAVNALQVTPVPLPLLVPARRHGAWLRAAHAVNARASRVWPGGLAYQFVVACRPVPPSRERARETMHSDAGSRG